MTKSAFPPGNKKEAFLQKHAILNQTKSHEGSSHCLDLNFIFSNFAVELYKRRLEWLTTGSRKLFGVMDEQAVCIIVDIPEESEQNFHKYIDCITTMFKEQLVFAKKFNVMRVGEVCGVIISFRIFFVSELKVVFLKSPFGETGMICFTKWQKRPLKNKIGIHTSSYRKE